MANVKYLCVLETHPDTIHLLTSINYAFNNQDTNLRVSYRGRGGGGAPRDFPSPAKVPPPPPPPPEF